MRISLTPGIYFWKHNRATLERWRIFVNDIPMRNMSWRRQATKTARAFSTTGILSVG